LTDSRSGHFIPEERVTVTHYARGRVGPRAGLDAVTEKIPQLTL